jgi:hypothetical protein
MTNDTRAQAINDIARDTARNAILHYIQLFPELGREVAQLVTDTGWSGAERRRGPGRPKGSYNKKKANGAAQAARVHANTGRSPSAATRKALSDSMKRRWAERKAEGGRLNEPKAIVNEPPPTEAA